MEVIHLESTKSAWGVLSLLYVITALFSCPSVFARESALSLSQLIDYSLQNSGELKALREEKGIKDAARIRAGILPNPTLEFEVKSGALTGSKNESSLGLGISQEFVLGGKRDKRLALAERELEVYRWQLTDRERLLRGEVKNAYFDLLLATERLELADRSMALNRQLLDVTRARLAAGDIPELEMNLAKVELGRSELTRIEALKGVQQSQSRLLVLTGLTDSQAVISGKLDSSTKMQKTPTELKQIALSSRPDIKLLESEKRRGEADMLLADAEGVPNLTAGLLFSRDATSMEIGGVEGKDTAYTVGVRLSMPIPVFDRNQASIQEASARKSSSEIRLRSAVRSIEQETEGAYRSYQSATSVLSLYGSDIIPQLEENLKLTQEAYRLGEVGILSLFQEQKKFIEVSEGYLTALHDRQAALVRLESVTASELTGGIK
ncbi:MAG: TolC family protein [Geobacteraceae bacterium]|nr:TolC family protein [Geobacteraceae bacterium]